VTVAFDCTRRGADAQRGIDLRWKAIRDDLHHRQVPAEVLDDLAERLTTERGPGGPVGRLVVADLTTGRRPAVVVDEWLPEPPPEGDTTCCGPVPDLRLLARAVQRHPAHLTAVLDRGGAHLGVHPVLAVQPITERVDGDHEILHKVRTGDASQQRLQRRADDSWQHNAAAVAQRLAELCREHDPVAIILSGDEHACSWLRREASSDVKRLLITPPDGTTAGAEGGERHSLDTVISKEVETALADFLQYEGRQDRAAQGRGPVAAALRRGQVSRLLVVDRPTSESTVDVAPDGLPVVEEDVDGEPVPTAAALLAGGAATAAEITLVPEEAGIVDGVGAVLRWSDAGTPQDSARSMPGHGEGGGW